MRTRTPLSVPTHYRGITFRSKLEADWAAYFDFERIVWSYESEAYALSNGARYLPDFHLSTMNIFVECRGALERSLRKPALFLKECCIPLLLALPQGRFALFKNEDSETGEPTNRYVDALFDGDEGFFQYMQERVSCFSRVEADAICFPHQRFENLGDSSPDYCGYTPDWSNSMKGVSSLDGGDTRTYYWGGRSTWQQRGFTPYQWKPKQNISH